MRRQMLFTACLLWAGCTCYSQLLLHPLVPTAVSTGAYSSAATDAFSFVINPAALPALQGFAAGVYGERRFLLPELGHYTAAVAMPLPGGGIGLRLNTGGFTGYRETGIGVAFGRSLGQQVDAGLQFSYQYLQAGTYGKAAAIGAAAGFMLHWNAKLHTGVLVENPAGGRFGKTKAEKLRSRYAMGAGYEASEKFHVLVELSKEENMPVSMQAAFAYRILSTVRFSGGIVSSTGIVWAGAGFLWHQTSVDILNSYHPQLGISPSLRLLFLFKKQSS